MVAPAGAASHARTSGERTAIGRRSRTQLIAIGSRAAISATRQDGNDSRAAADPRGRAPHTASAAAPNVRYSPAHRPHTGHCSPAEAKDRSGR